MLVVTESKCVGCGICVTSCPEDALRAWGKSEVDMDKCTECQICIEWCPVSALGMSA